MSLKKIKRRLSQTFRISLDGSLSALAEHLTLEENGEYKENGNRSGSVFTKNGKRLTRSHSRILESSSHRSSGSLVSDNPRIGSDGESEDLSLASDIDIISPVRLRQKHRHVSEQDISKRLSLPADLRIPESFLDDFERISPILDGNLTRTRRRQSLAEIGFGRMETYTKLDKLGEGTYATVYKGKSRLTDTIVALKEIRLEHDEGAPCTAIREVSLLKELKHANIVTLHDIVHTEKALTLVFEYLDKDLKQYMEDCGNVLSMNNVKLFLFQLLRGLAYIHTRRVLHRDLKPQNLLISEKGELKLADFGLARAKSVPTRTYSNEVVTLWYRPPDVLVGSTTYSSPIDMWGVGCIFYEMSTGRPLFPGGTVDEELQLIFKVLGEPSDYHWPGNCDRQAYRHHGPNSNKTEPLSRRVPRLEADGSDMLHQFLWYEARRRISACDAIKHNYFKSLGPNVHKLPDTVSIFTCPGIQLSKDPGVKSGVGSSSKRRQSMLMI